MNTHEMKLTPLLIWLNVACFRDEILVISDPYIYDVESQSYLDYFQNTSSKMKTSDYECTHKMELFDIYFV